MELEWESDFETGNEYVDLQHRYFLNLIARIRKNFRETNDADYKRKLIVELKKYAEFHFTSEENIATSHNLPEAISSHHQRHLRDEHEYELNHVSIVESVGTLHEGSQKHLSYTKNDCNLHLEAVRKVDLVF